MSQYVLDHLSHYRAQRLTGRQIYEHVQDMCQWLFRNVGPTKYRWSSSVTYIAKDHPGVEPIPPGADFLEFSRSITFVDPADLMAFRIRFGV